MAHRERVNVREDDLMLLDFLATSGTAASRPHAIRICLEYYKREHAKVVRDFEDWKKDQAAQLAAAGSSNGKPGHAAPKKRRKAI